MFNFQLGTFRDSRRTKSGCCCCCCSPSRSLLGLQRSLPSHLLQNPTLCSFAPSKMLYLRGWHTPGAHLGATLYLARERDRKNHNQRSEARREWALKSRRLFPAHLSPFQPATFPSIMSNLVSVTITAKYSPLVASLTSAGPSLGARK